MIKEFNKKHKLVDKIIFSNTEIKNGIIELAEKLNKKYKNIKEPILLLGILKGCGPFMFELMKYLDFDFKIDFMIASSYFGGLEKKINNPKIVLDVDYSVENHHVLIIEDIVETGHTVKSIKKHLNNKNVKDIKIISLLYKKVEKSILKPDFYVFDAPHEFLIGFGLDYDEKLRNLGYIATLKKDKQTCQ